MRLTKEEKEMLEGIHGYPVQKSMEILVGLGECFDAERMIPVSSAHILSTLGGIGEGGNLFIQEMANKGGKFTIFTDTNPLSIEPWLWKDFGISEEFAQEEISLNNTCSKMGAFLCNTCTPYLIGHNPQFRQHVAWNESSAIVFANSVLGARTNREGGPSALAAALTGRVPEYGYHLDRNRHGNFGVVVNATLNHLHDYGTLGYFIGKIAEDKVPVFFGIPHSVHWDELKHLGAAVATSGSVALFHVIGVTPEALTEEAAFGPRRKKGLQMVEFGEKELKETEGLLSKVTEVGIDLVIFGCPHTSITEFKELAQLLSEKKIKSTVELWVSTSRMVKTYAEVMGYANIIESSGAKILCNACPIAVARRRFTNDLGPRAIATNSAKLTYYITQGHEFMPYYGSTERCIQAATCGKWR